MSVTQSFSTLPQRIEIAFWTAVIPLMKEAPLPRLPRRPAIRQASALHPAESRMAAAWRSPAASRLLAPALGFGLAGLALGFTLGYLMVFVH